MAYTNPVADFVSSLDSFYESVSIDDLEMVVGPIERGNSIGILIVFKFIFLYKTYRFYKNV